MALFSIQYHFMNNYITLPTQLTINLPSMINSLTSRPSEATLAFLDPTQLQQLSPQQRKWAQTQFRILYAGIYFVIQPEQMAKLTAELQHQQRIKTNLLNKQKQQDESIRLNSMRLQSKMQGIEAKRQMHYDSKQKAYKLNQQKWTKKITDIETKFRHQNREAIQKAEKYRQQSQDYWKNKQSHLVTARGTSYQKFDLNKTQKVVVNNLPDSLTHRTNVPGISRHYRNSKMATLQLEDINNIGMNSDTSRGNLKHSRTIDIDGEISKHKERSSMIQKQRQTLIFQNAMKRLAKIQMTRKKAQKLRQPSKSPVQIRKPKSTRQQDEDPYGGDYSSKRKTIQQSKSKDSLINETLQSHIKAKRLIEEQQFRERDKILEGQHKRKRQDKILKAIKNKIKDIKSSTVKMQALQ